MVDAVQDIDPEDPAEVAEAAGLKYVSDAEPGIRRVARGRGFSYVRPNGSTVPGRERDRIEGLAIPPAWTDVWISPDPEAHLLATGRDDADRKQYRYHDRWRAIRDAMKFERMAEFGERLGPVRRDVEGYLADHGLPRSRVLAAVVRLLDRSLIRIGNEEYAADNETFGATTLLSEHVQRERGGVHLVFPGKGGVERDIALSDEPLVRVIDTCLETPHEDLFWYRTTGGTADVTSDDVNEFLQELAGDEFSAKDFRTWGGTAVAAGHLVEGPPPAAKGAREAELLAALDAAAERLGNTRAVCRACYVAPQVGLAYETEQLLEAWRSSRRTRWLDRIERTTGKVLRPA